MPLPSLSPAGRLFAVAAFLEGFTWAGLLIGMWLKYGLEVTDQGVWLFGRLHGGAFLFYLAVSLFTGVRLRWPGWALLLAVLAAIPPRIERQWPPRVISSPRLRVHLRLCVFRE